MIKFDMTSAYHFIDIFEAHTEYLGFSWVSDEGKTIYYKLLVLPFGLSTASYVFVKVTRPLVQKWRGEGKMMVLFLDDGFGCNSTFENTSVIAAEVKADLLNSRFVPKVEKTFRVPVQVGDFWS